MHCDIIWVFNGQIIFKKGKVAVPELQLCNEFAWSKVMKQYQALSQEQLSKRDRLSTAWEKENVSH